MSPGGVAVPSCPIVPRNPPLAIPICVQIKPLHLQRVLRILKEPNEQERNVNAAAREIVIRKWDKNSLKSS